MKPDGMHEEIELKLALPRTALPALRRHPLIASAQVSMPTTLLENTYYDTADLALMGLRVGLRTRRIGSRCLQTVKCASTSTGGLSRRPEWEQAFEGEFDFSAIDLPDLKNTLEMLRPQLAALFTTRFERETREYAAGTHTRIEIMIDTGSIVAGDKTEPLCEVELELVRGTPNALLELAVQLAQTLPLIPHDASKAERGYALSLDRPLRARQARATICPLDASPVTAFRALAFECLAQWQYNTWGAATHGDSEFIHQARVALRRLRTLLTTFSPVLSAPFKTHWQTLLKEQSELLATTRNLDVIVDDVLPSVQPPTDSDDAAAHEQLCQRLAKVRDKSRRATLRRLSTTPGPGAAQLALVQALYPLNTSATKRRALLCFAPAQLDRLHHKLCKRLGQATAEDATKLHALRIAIKQLRYALEQLAPSLPIKKKALAAYLKALSLAQTQLGRLNDINMLANEPALSRMATRNAAVRQSWAYARGWLGAAMLESTNDILHGVRRTAQKPVPWTTAKQSRP